MRRSSAFSQVIMAALLALAGCSADPETTVGPSSSSASSGQGGTGGTGGASSSATASSSSSVSASSATASSSSASSASTGGADGGPTCDPPAPECNAPEQCGTLVLIMQVATDAPPALGGGSIPDGTYL